MFAFGATEGSQSFPALILVHGHGGTVTCVEMALWQYSQWDTPGAQSCPVGLWGWQGSVIYS